MANLRKGTTIGGYPIITEFDENDHIHHASEIDGLGDVAQVVDGQGSGFDADTLGGNHVSDMNDLWVNVAGDTIDSSIVLTGDLRTASDLAAVNSSYVNDFIKKNSITQSEAIPYVAVDTNFTINRSSNVFTAVAGDILIGGYFYRYSNLVKDVTLETGVNANTTYYLYMKVSSDTIYLEVDSSNEAYGYYRILVGEFTTDSIGNVTTHSTYPKPSNLGQIIIISDEPRSNSIINANNTITSLDAGWYRIRDGDNVDSVSLYGATEVAGGSTVQYKITDYDEPSTYSVSNDSGSLLHDGDTITFTAPVVAIDSITTIYVTRNQTTQAFRVSVLS